MWRHAGGDLFAWLKRERRLLGPQAQHAGQARHPIELPAAVGLHPFWWPGDARRLAFHYVDGFAGRGRYSSEEPGSPLIAMEIGQELYELIDPFGPKGVELDEARS